MSAGNEFELDENVCPTCGQDGFSSLHGVKTHHSIKHDKKLPNLVCKQCNSKFYNRTARELCNDCLEDPYVCPECSQVFSKVRRRNIHHKNKHGKSISTTTIVCDKCGNKISYNRDRKSVTCDCGEIIDLTQDYHSVHKNPELCPNCEHKFVNMGQHWKSSNCSYPKLSRYQRDLLRGMLMSDGTVQFDQNNRIKVKMTSKAFLEWFGNQLDEICPDKYPILQQTSEESKKSAKDYFGDAVDEESEYKEKYKILTRSHPFINEFDDWYVPQKQYPLDDIELTPTVAKMWYCGDGTLDKNRYNAEIACTNESHRIEDVANLVREKGFHASTSKKGVVRIPTSETPRFLEWMGDPPPDFEYKWL